MNDTTKPSTPHAITVSVLNGTGITGQAAATGKPNDLPVAEQAENRVLAGVTALGDCADEVGNSVLVDGDLSEAGTNRDDRFGPIYPGFGGVEGPDHRR